MSGRRHGYPAIAAIIALALAACSLEPYEMRDPAPIPEGGTFAEDTFQSPFQPRPEPLRTGQNPWAEPTVPNVVLICYGRPSNTPEEVRAVARQYCPEPDYALRLEEQTTFWNSCSLLQPHLAKFACERK